MARKQQDNAPAPAAQPAYKVVKREKDRWWEVRDPQDEAGVREGLQARRSRGGAPAGAVTGSRPRRGGGRHRSRRHPGHRREGGRRTAYSQPFSRAARAASMRLAAPSLAMASER
jgi:hypothetical protein